VIGTNSKTDATPKTGSGNWSVTSRPHHFVLPGMTFTEPYFNYHEFYRQMALEPFTRYVELGVHTGASIAFLAQRLKETGRPFELYGVDLWQEGINDYAKADDYNTFLTRLNSLDLLDDIRAVQCDSAKASWQHFDRSVDFVFIDAAHDYESVKKDILAWRPKIRASGIISGHDYGEPCGVKQAVDELIPEPTITGTVWWKRI
jgi:hypothetical protein